MLEDNSPGAGYHDAPDEEAQASAHHGEGGGHAAKKHGKGHDGDHGHGGGHGGSWIVTYCDMVTLLIACFICIITFASKEPEKYSKKRDSILYGQDGEGIAGGEQRRLDRDSMVWRQRPISSRVRAPGSEIAPHYSDPALEATAEVLRSLEGPTIGQMGDRYTMRVPLATLFASEKRLSETGQLLLRAIGRNLRSLPYELYLQMDDAGQLPQGILMAHYLMADAAIHPSRIGVGVRDGGEPWHSSVSMIFARRP